MDNTLYPAGCGLFERVDARIDEYLRTRVGIPECQVPALRRRYRDAYGVTLAGLMAEHGTDPEDYLPFVHDVGVEELLAPDPELRRALAGLPGRKVAFTNGSRAHAGAVLARLGVAGVIEAVFDIAFMGYVPKPRPQGYRRLLAALGAAADECWMVDDVVANLDTARDLGMGTVLVAPLPSGPHRHVASPRELGALLAAAPGPA